MCNVLSENSERANSAWRKQSRCTDTVTHYLWIIPLFINSEVKGKFNTLKLLYEFNFGYFWSLFQIIHTFSNYSNKSYRKIGKQNFNEINPS